MSEGGRGFERASAVTDLGDGRYEGCVAEGWDIVGNANGGYLLAIAARALASATGRPDPVTLTGHYLAPGDPGPVTVETEVVRSGRRFATASARLRSPERPLLTVLGTFGDLSPVAGEAPPAHVDGGPPALPEPDDCVALTPGELFPPPFTGRVEIRLHPDDAGFVAGAPTGVLQMRGWFRLRDGEPLDTLGLVLAADAFPPNIFNGDLPIAWTPTIELTTHVRARPAPGWLACRFGTRFVTNGFLEADGELWDADGRLVAQSRQLALVPRS